MICAMTQLLNTMLWHLFPLAFIQVDADIGRDAESIQLPRNKLLISLVRLHMWPPVVALSSHRIMTRPLSLSAQRCVLLWTTTLCE